MKPALMVNFSPLNCLANLLMTRMGAMGSPWDRAREVVPFRTESISSRPTLLMAKRTRVFFTTA